MRIIVITIFMISLLSVQNCTCTRKFDDSGFLYMEEEYAMARKNFKSGKWDQAIEWYDRLKKDYPDNPYTPEGLFIKAYILKTYKKDIPAAENYFNELIKNYPGSEFSESAEFELKHIDDPDFVPEFEKEAKE